MDAAAEVDDEEEELCIQSVILCWSCLVDENEKKLKKIMKKYSSLHFKGKHLDTFDFFIHDQTTCD